MKIYLDRNIYEDMRQNRNNAADFIQKCQILVKKGNTILASAIHAEEIATPYVSGENDSYIHDEIEFIESITHKKIILPSRESRSGFIEVIEDMNRRVKVVKDAIKETREALKNDIDKKLPERKLNFCQVYNIEDNNFSNIEPEEIFNDKKICYLLDQYINKFPLPYFDNYVERLMTIIEKLYDFLDIVKYKTIKINSKEKIRSRMYDVGHTIYASYCDYLITNDKKMKAKAIAIYTKLNIRTKVLSSNEFFNIGELF